MLYLICIASFYVQAGSVYPQVWSLHLKVRSWKMKSQLIIPDYFYLHTIFNLHSEFIYAGTISILVGIISILIGIFSIPTRVMCIPVGMILVYLYTLYTCGRYMSVNFFEHRSVNKFSTEGKIFTLCTIFYRGNWCLPSR